MLPEIDAAAHQQLRKLAGELLELTRAGHGRAIQRAYDLADAVLRLSRATELAGQITQGGPLALTFAGELARLVLDAPDPSVEVVADNELGEADHG